MNYLFEIEIVQHIISINVVIYVGMVLFSQLKIETYLALYNPFDPFFNFLQFISYMFIHSIHSFLHVTFNMFILYIWGMQLNLIFGPLKFIIIYFTSGITAGLFQNLLKILIIYYYTGILDLYKISHGFKYYRNIQRLNLQYSMYIPLIGASGAIYAIIGSFTILKFLLWRKIFIINVILYYIFVLLNIFPSISHLSHFIGAIAGSYNVLCH